jgi:hypothetical protein
VPPAVTLRLVDQVARGRAAKGAEPAQIDASQDRIQSRRWGGSRRVPKSAGMKCKHLRGLPSVGTHPARELPSDHPDALGRGRTQRRAIAIVQPETVLRWHRPGATMAPRWAPRPCGRPARAGDGHAFPRNVDHDERDSQQGLLPGSHTLHQALDRATRRRFPRKCDRVQLVQRLLTAKRDLFLEKELAILDGYDAVVCDSC